MIRSRRARSSKRVRRTCTETLYVPGQICPETIFVPGHYFGVPPLFFREKFHLFRRGLGDGSRRGVARDGPATIDLSVPFARDVAESCNDTLKLQCPHVGQDIFFVFPTFFFTKKYFGLTGFCMGGAAPDRILFSLMQEVIMNAMLLRCSSVSSVTSKKAGIK